MRRVAGFRKPARTILIVTEGPTEETYFKGLADRNINIKIVTKSRTRTKPHQIVDYCKIKMKEYDIDLKEGDVAFAVFDVDNNTDEDLSHAIRIAEKSKIRAIISNPCFEIWFLMHFRDCQIPLIDYDRIVEELNHHGLSYQKNKDYRTILSPLKETDMRNSKRIAEESNLKTCKDFFNTSYSTNVYEILDCIENIRNSNEP